MDAHLKLSEVSQRCGISVAILRQLIDDGLLQESGRAGNGHPLLSLEAVPTWEQCRDLITAQRDRSIVRALEMLDRVSVEVEAVRNDLVEAREHPQEPLGVDLLTSGHYVSGDQSTLATALQELSLARFNVVVYQRLLREIVSTAC
jgi:DNA-binding transcriptional MerR regulator